MKLYPFYLFYLLTLVCLAIGLFGTDTETFHSMSASSFGVTVAKNLNRPYFLVAAALSLLTGLIYQGFHRSGKIVSKILVFIHSITAALGILLTLNLYRLILLLVDAGTPDTTSLGTNGGGLLLMLLGPLFLLACLILFIVALVTVKRVKV